MCWCALLLGGAVVPEQSRAIALQGPTARQGTATGESSRGADDASILQFLHTFEQASEANDANQKAELYAEQVDRYFLRTHVTRQFVYRDLLDWLGRGRLITRFRLTVLSGVDGGEEKTLLVRKDAEWIDGGARRTLSTRSQLVLRRTGGSWRIVSERDFRPGR